MCSTTKSDRRSSNGSYCGTRMARRASAATPPLSPQIPPGQAFGHCALPRNGGGGSRRYAAFIDANPDWPSMRQLRRRAEGRLWQEKIDGATVHRFTADQPVSGAGRLALARTLLNEGDRDGAAREARQAWQ